MCSLTMTGIRGRRGNSLFEIHHPQSGGDVCFPMRLLSAFILFIYSLPRPCSMSGACRVRNILCTRCQCSWAIGMLGIGLRNRYMRMRLKLRPRHYLRLLMHGMSLVLKRRDRAHYFMTGFGTKPAPISFTYTHCGGEILL